MNNSYKVVYNKARGALMIVNELTSSIQKKGTKSVIAMGAVLALTGVAQNVAALETVTLEGWSDNTQEVKTQEDNWAGGSHYYTKNVTAVDVVFANNSLLAKGDTGTDAQGGAMYLNAHTQNAENTINNFENIKFENNLVKTESNQGTRASAYGGALLIKGGATTLKNTIFTGNKAEATSTLANSTSSSQYGGGSAAGGAIFIDSTLNNPNNHPATLKFVVDTDGLISSGNTVSSGQQKPFTDGWNTKVPTAGGFLYMDRGVTADFDISEGITYTIGTKDAYKQDKNMDSIASSVYLKTATHPNNVINKTGAGTLVMHGSLNDYYGTLNVNEGTLEVTSDWALANEVKVASGTLILGNASFTTVKAAAGYDGSAGGTANDVVDDAGSLTIQSGGSVIVNSLTLNSGSVSVGGSLTVGTLTTGNGTLSFNGGTIVTSIGQLFNDDAGSAATLESTSFSAKTGITLSSGILSLTDDGTYDVSVLSALESAINSNSIKSVTFTNAKFESTTSDEKTGLFAGIIAATSDATVTATPTAGVVDITTSNAGAATLTVETENDTDTLSSVKVTSTTNELTLVGDNSNSQLVSDKDGKALDITVEGNATLKLGSSLLEKETSGQVANITAEENSKIAVANINAEATSIKAAQGAIVSVGSDDKRATLGVSQLTLEKGSLLIVDPTWSNDAAMNVIGNASQAIITNADIQGAAIAGRNGLIVYGASASDAETAFDRLTSLKWGEQDISAALYVGKTLTVNADGKVIVDGTQTSSSNNPDSYQAGAVTVAADGLLMVDNQIDGGKVIDGNLIMQDGSILGLVNTNVGTLTLANQVTGTVNVVTDNPFMEAEVSTDNTSVTVGLDAENGLSALASTGIQAMARRADFTMSETIADRTAIDQTLHAGINMWADVSGERYEADKFDNNGNFKADLGYGMFGGDVALTDDIAVGAGFQYGTGSLRSDVASIKNEIDSYGFTLYGSMKLGDAKIVGELAWLQSKNDITSSQTALNQKVDADIWSAGIRAQHAFTLGQFMVTPSVGVRVSYMETDAMNIGAVMVEKQDQTLVQIPLALRITGAPIQSSSGWSLAPNLKIAYVPTFGDKEIKVLGYETDVIDTSPVQGAFGIRASNGNMLFKADMTVGGGEYGTSSIGAKVGFKYAF